MLRETFLHAWLTLYHLTLDFIRLLSSLLQSKCALAAENLFLRKQLALYPERQVRPRRASDATRLTMVWLGKLFDWKGALVAVRPETFIGWQRQSYQRSSKRSRMERRRNPESAEGLRRHDPIPISFGFG